MALETKDIVVMAAAILSALVTITVPIINNVFSDRQYTREKTWDIKKDTYNKILLSLDSGSKQYGALGIFNLPEGQETDGSERAYDTVKEGFKFYRDNHLICSDEVRELMTEVEKEDLFYLRPPGGQPLDMAKIGQKLRRYHTDLLKMTRKELSIR
jgi:hypothetical protein